MGPKVNDPRALLDRSWLTSGAASATNSWRPAHGGAETVPAKPFLSWRCPITAIIEHGNPVRAAFDAGGKESPLRMVAQGHMWATASTARSCWSACCGQHPQNSPTTRRIRFSRKTYQLQTLAKPQIKSAGPSPAGLRCSRCSAALEVDRASLDPVASKPCRPTPPCGVEQGQRSMRWPARRAVRIQSSGNTKKFWPSFVQRDADLAEQTFCCRRRR